MEAGSLMTPSSSISELPASPGTLVSFSLSLRPELDSTMTCDDVGEAEAIASIANYNTISSQLAINQLIKNYIRCGV